MLCNEPFNLTVSEIADLTPYQARNLYFCKRQEDGRVIVEYMADDSDGFTEAEMFREHWRLNGLRPDLIDRLWLERKT